MEGSTSQSWLQNGLKILVLARHVPDSNLLLPLKQGVPDYSAFSWVLNPFDEVATEAAVQLRQQFKEQHPDLPAEVIIVGRAGSAGTAAVERALSLGGDRALLLSEAEEPQIFLAQLIEQIREIAPHLVLLGRMALGEEKGELAGQLAGTLDWPLATAVSELVLENQALNFLQRRITQSRHASLTLPAIVSAELDLAIPRYVTLPALVAARRKPKQMSAPVSADIETEIAVMPENWQSPPTRQTGCKVNDVHELLARLAEQGMFL